MMNSEETFTKAAIESVHFMASHTAAEVSIMTLRNAYAVGYRHGYSQAVIDNQKDKNSNGGRYDHVHGDEDDGYEYDDRDWDMVEIDQGDEK